MEKTLQQYKSMIKFLSLALGDIYEAGLFDMTDPQMPVITSTNEQSDVHEAIRRMLAEADLTNTEYLTNRSVASDSEKLLKVSAFLIRNAENTVTAAMWLSMRCDFFIRMDAFANAMLRFDTDFELPEAEKPVNVNSTDDIADTVREKAAEYAEDPSRLSLAERQELVVDLYDAGIFNRKGAVAKVAEVLRISEQSVYRYLAKIKKARDW